ncbi:hypothetical protein LC048_24480 [Mesobacillus subterraneus]|uniref:hypothetical protein n=1 Tax=Mesobacillus subterraneus TaxID=285983 RepID=UPI001CFD0E2C|nr:hypothetical protein [Mesobacillus subterraneus]WLR55380.1 hypothetical protein LC048_24480 [Mesobacillus subterraneus]
MKREARLQSAKSWLKNYDGKHVVKSYSKWFGVDSICAMNELEVLGLRFSEKQKKKLNEAYDNKVRQKQLSRARRLQKTHKSWRWRNILKGMALSRTTQREALHSD